MSLKEGKSFKAVSARGEIVPVQGRYSQMEQFEPLLSFLTKKGEALLQNDFLYIKSSEGRQVYRAMANSSIEAAVPIIMEGKLEAVLGLGPKSSGEPYTREDVNLLSALASQLAVALKNVSLYQEVVELKSEKNLTHKLASMGELAAGIAHEIKNPLVSIRTYAELLPEKYEDEEFRLYFSQVVTKEIERINNLITELLSFARASKSHIKKIDMPALLEEVLFLIAPQCEAQKIDIIRQYPDWVPPVIGDKDKLKQAFLNICLNGTQAMPGGGQLKVGVLSPACTGEKCDCSEGKIRVFIEDTGEGVPLNLQDKIFEPFYTTKPEGTGLGLSISHRIISDHSGAIYCHSNGSGGTCIEVILPLGQQAEELAE